MTDGDQSPALAETTPSNGVALSVVVRLLAVAVLAWLVPVAGLIALTGLVILWLFRTRIDLTTVIVLYAIALWMIPSRYTIGAFAVTGAMFFGFVAFGLWAFGRALPVSRVARGASPANRAVLTLLFVTLAEYVVVALRPLSSLDQRSIDRNLAVVVGLCGLAVAITDGVRTKRQLNRVIGAVVLGGAIVAFIGYLQYFAHFDVGQYLRPPGFNATGQEGFIYQRSGLARVAGTARHPIEFGLALAATLPLALHLGAYARTSVARAGSRLAALLIAAAIPLSLSRSAVLSTILVALIILPTWAPARRWRLLLGLVITLVVVNTLLPGVFDTIVGLFNGTQGTGSIATRTDATGIAFNLIGHNPVFGNGFALSVPTPVVINIDSQYLVTLVETGLVGLVALLVAMGGGVGAARQVRRTTSDPANRDLAQSLIATIAAVALGGFGLAIVRYPLTAGLLFIAIGSAGALLRICTRTAIVDVPEERRERIGVGP